VRAVRIPEFVHDKIALFVTGYRSTFSEVSDFDNPGREAWVFQRKGTGKKAAEPPHVADACVGNSRKRPTTFSAPPDAFSPSRPGRDRKHVNSLLHLNGQVRDILRLRYCRFRVVKNVLRKLGLALLGSPRVGGSVALGWVFTVKMFAPPPVGFAGLYQDHESPCAPSPNRFFSMRQVVRLPRQEPGSVRPSAWPRLMASARWLSSADSNTPFVSPAHLLLPRPVRPPSHFGRWQAVVPEP